MFEEPYGFLTVQQIGHQVKQAAGKKPEGKEKGGPVPGAEKIDLQQHPEKPEQRQSQQQRFPQSGGYQLNPVIERYICGNQKNIGQAKIQDLHNCTVNLRELCQRFIPGKYLPEKEVKNGQHDIEYTGCQNQKIAEIR